MKEEKIMMADEEYTILKCDNNFKLSTRISREFPDFVLIRQCTLVIIALIHDKIQSGLGRFLITGTPGVGKTVSIIVWLYLAFKGELKVPFKHIIADLKTGCVLLSRNETANTWEEQLYVREFFVTNRFEATNDVLYLYDATISKLPLILPYCSVVFSSPNLCHFKEFISIDAVRRMVYFMPMWEWDEIEVFHNFSTELQEIEVLEGIKRLFQLWGGLPRQIFVPYATGQQALDDSIKNCNAVASIQILEKGNFLSYGENDAKEVRSKLMQFDVVDDGSYESALVNFGSTYIRDKIVEATDKGFANYYREFMLTHGSSEFAAKVRGNLYERLVLDKLRGLSGSMSLDVLTFSMERGKPNSAVSVLQLPAMPYAAKEYSNLDEISDIGGIVWIPKQSNFKSFDVLVASPPPPLPPLWVQITVGKQHSLNVEGVHACLKQVDDAVIVFCLPPDIFESWYRKNSVQRFVTQSGKVATMHQYLNDVKQMVMCIPGDAIEEENVKTLMSKLNGTV